MMNSAGTEPHLRDFEAASLAQQDVLLRHADVVEADVHVTMGRVIVAEDMHRPQNIDPRCVFRYQNL